MGHIKSSLPLLATLALVLAAPSYAEKLNVVPANEASREAFQVNHRINWYNNLEDARCEAAKSGKLVFWVQMLGSMDGKT